MKQLISSAWKWLTDWFENGDLIPLLIVVSAYHYASILSAKDSWFVAVCIGILVDIGHFRTIRAAFRYQPTKAKKRKKLADGAHWFMRVEYHWEGLTRRFGGQVIARWIVALVMTGISLAYHQRYYNDFFLSAPIPFLIAALAWLQKVDKKIVRPTPITKTDTSITKIDTSMYVVSTPQKMYTCRICSNSFDNSSKLALHYRWQHAAEKSNGKVKVIS